MFSRAVVRHVLDVARHHGTLGTGVRGDAAGDFAYDALNRLRQAKEDDLIVCLTYDRLRCVLTGVQDANPLGTTVKTVSCSCNVVSAALQKFGP